MGQPIAGGDTASVPVPMLIPVWAVRNEWPQCGLWLGLGIRQEVFGQGSQYLGKPPWEGAGLPPPPCVGAGEGSGGNKRVQTHGFPSPWLKRHIGSARPGSLRVWMEDVSSPRKINKRINKNCQAKRGGRVPVPAQPIHLQFSLIWADLCSHFHHKHVQNKADI